jgi:hypothetical protein
MAVKQNQQSTGSKIRLAILLSILLIVAVLGGYDYLIARPGWNRAKQTLDRLQAEQNAAKAQEGQKAWKTRDDIHQQLGRSPSEVDERQYSVVETYRWRAGKLYDTYDLYVMYSLRGGQMTLTNYQDQPFDEESHEKGPIDVKGIGDDADPASTPSDADETPGDRDQVQGESTDIGEQ